MVSFPEGKQDPVEIVNQFWHIACSVEDNLENKVCLFFSVSAFMY